MIGLFRKTYTLRHFGEQVIDRGHVTHPFTDSKTSINLQPLSANEIAALPEGQRATKRLKGYGDRILTTANMETGVVGDRIYYYGNWYECVSSNIWEHTILAHCESEFVLINMNEDDVTLAPPGED